MPNLTLSRRSMHRSPLRPTVSRAAARLTSAPSLKLRMLDRSEILDLLNEDFRRECQEIAAYAVYAERTGRDILLAAEISQRGQRAILHSLELGQIIHQLGGTIPHLVQEPGVRPTDDFEPELAAEFSWAEETAERLRERASHLILLDEIGLSVRIFRILKDKRSLPTLHSLVNSAS